MIKGHWRNITGIAAVLALTTASVQAGDRDSGVVYQGDDSAKSVCMSIVRDDVPGLKKAFFRGRAFRFERSHLMYRCNDLRLDEFAFTQSAERTYSYLAPMYPSQGRVTVEQVGSIGH